MNFLFFFRQALLFLINIFQTADIPKLLLPSYQLKRQKKQKISVLCQRERWQVFIITALMNRWSVPTKSCWIFVKSSNLRFCQMPMNFVSMTTSPPEMKMNILLRYFSIYHSYKSGIQKRASSSRLTLNNSCQKHLSS